MMTIEVVLADDHTFVRAGIRKILETHPEIQVIGEAGNGEEAIQVVIRLQPDVLLLDVQMPVKNGLQVARELRGMNFDTRILVLSAYDDSQYILGMLEEGVSGYLTKDEAPEVVIQAVTGVVEDRGFWVSQRVAERLGIDRRLDGNGH